VREALMLLETEILCPGSVCEEAPAQTFSSDSECTTKPVKGVGTIYTIGAEGCPPKEMAEVVKALGVHLVLDCCWWKNRAHKSVLKDAYEWAGDTLAIRGKGDHEDGIKRVLGLASSGKSVMLMGNTESPGECNRHHTIAMELLARGVDVSHVYNDELILASELQASIEEERD
jgi:uncharacterized protein (DUF488 family)